MATTGGAWRFSSAWVVAFALTLSGCGGTSSDATGEASGPTGTLQAASDAGSTSVKAATVDMDVAANAVTASGISGVVDTSSSPVNLTTVGSTDWAHWGDGSETAVTRRAGSSHPITRAYVDGGGDVGLYADGARKMSWTNGSPIASSSNNGKGIFTSGVGRGFHVDVDAGLEARTVRVYVGGWNSGGTLRAALLDGSASDYVDVAPVISGSYSRNYQITYRAGRDGTLLRIWWDQHGGSGNVTFSAVAMSAPDGSAGLSGVVDSSANAINLSSVGPLDWVHWGNGGVPGIVRKSGATALITGYARVGDGTVYSYANDPRSVSWTGGTPVASSSENRRGIYVEGAGQGFKVDVAADTQQRTVRVLVGGWASSGTLRAHLSDGSAPDFVNTTSKASQQYNRTYTLTYRAASANQRLRITWTQASDDGNVTFNAVALSGSAANRPPVASITRPTVGTTFRAGDTIVFAGTAVDTEDGALPANRLVWWADLHHDTHSHPLQPRTTGNAGSVMLPVRGETSSNIWYRFHLLATDSSGLTHEVTRDIQPIKADVRLATSPTGLTLTLDGQPHTAPYTFTGVAGAHRDLGAAAQTRNGRRYVFSGWSDGGAAAHTIVTPSSAMTYTATFRDAGPVTNVPPNVSLSAPSSARVGTAVTLNASASDSDGTVSRVEFFDGSTRLGQDTSAPYAFQWTPGSAGAHTLTARATDNGGATRTSAPVTVNVSESGGGDGELPVARLTSPINLSRFLSGTITLSATATDNVGVASVEFQVDGRTIGSPVNSAPYSKSLDTAAYASGQHVVRARARDAAGNVGAWSTATVEFDTGRSLPTGFTLDSDWVSGIGGATAFAQAPDGRFFVAEQGSGKVRIVKNGVLLDTPFVQLSVDGRGERGVIGVTLHPNFASNGWVYVYYTSTSGGSHNRISRFVASGDVSTGVETVLVDLPLLSDATNHNGGAMHFGADGKLYVGVGDNANGDNSQTLSTPLGKMLRFNDNGSIPSDNPFYSSQSGLARAIWAYGLRNPFTFVIEPASSRMFINDVGQGTWEEINVGARGANYGWPASEGNTSTPGFTGPVFTYRHWATDPPGSGPGGFFTGACIIGGAFYPASGNFPATYRGTYFFADYVSGFVGQLDPANGYAAYSFARLNDTPVDMRVGRDGALYILTRGRIARLSVSGS